MYGLASNLYANDFPIVDMAQNLQNLTETATVWAVQGAFFRLNYDYKGKYLVELNGRYDGSSKYGSDDRWGFFPSASIAWRISEENFFEPVQNLFQNIKVRSSIGSLGNQVTNGNFDYLNMMGGSTLDYILDGKRLSAITPSSLAYMNVSWEKVTTADFGLDLGLLNNRLNASFDYFIRYTADMVVSKKYPATLGSTGGRENLASMRTNGWELSINWRDKINDVKGSPLVYDLSIGLSDSYSTITKYDNPTGTLDDFYEGKRLGEIWGYTTEGFILSETERLEQVERQSYISDTWRIGDIKYADLDGNGKVNNGNSENGPINTLSNHGDLKVIGNQTPRYRFNLSLGLNWKGFDIRTLFEGTMKRDLWLGGDIFWGYNGQWNSALNDYIVDNTWTPENPNSYYPLATFSNRSRQTQTKYLQNAAYIRMRDLTLGYTLPQTWLSPLNVSHFKIFFSAQNLCEATGLYKYLDPDMTGTYNNDGTMAGDMKNYPFCRTYSFGINLTF